ncbi:hypothetical protein GX563_04510 [Candidatus Bathyarchaeota archaeon]|nr:hypothetical protein [Candidatus Bathyarchaeota archaeon]
MRAKKSKAYGFFIITLFFAAVALSINTGNAQSAAENTWQTKSPLPKTEDGLAAATVNGKIYVMGGSLNYEYNPANDSWTSKTSMPTPRNWVSIAVYQNRIYTFGGTPRESASNITEIYDPSTDAWTKGNMLPFNVSGLTVNVVDGKVYFIGGNPDQPTASTNMQYDIASGTWTNKTQMPTPVTAFQSVVLDGKIYVFGGYNPTPTNLTQIYDPVADSWSLGAQVPEPYPLSTAAATTNAMAPSRIYIFGGSLTLFDSTNLVQVYNPKNDSWTMGEPMLSNRCAGTVAVVSDQIYVIGGRSAPAFTPPLTTNEVYTPFGYGNPEREVPPDTSNLPIIIAIIVIFFIGVGALIYLKKR